jgi:hypothetical protein
VTYQFGFEMYSRTRVCICLSISLVWSPTWVYVQRGSASCQFTNKQPDLSKQIYLGKSGKIDQVSSSTLGLYILKWIGSLDTPPFWPATRNVSCSISCLISAKSIKQFCEVEELAPLVATRGVDQLAEPP